MADLVATTSPRLQERFAGGGLARLPGARQAALLIGIAAAVAIGVALVLWLRTPSYALLYGGLEAKDAAAVTQALAGLNEPYQLSADGGAILVPEADIPAVRLKLAAQGLPRGGASAVSEDGSSTSPFGLSDFAEKARYQARLESDLANTIASLQSVQSARVHLALPKSSAFIRDQRPASASVVVTLYAGRSLDAGQVAAIVHLVAASVPDLDPRNVSVIDQKGELLTASNPGGAAAVADGRFRLTQTVESAYADRVEEILAPLVGAGHVRAQVVADLDFTETEKTSETYDNKNPALRSEQVSSDTRVAGGGAQGIPGALSNQPPSTPPQPTAANPAAGATPAGAAPSTATAAAATPTDTSSSATRNYELDRTISHVRDPIGSVTRLSVAVVVDDRHVVGKDGKVSDVPYSATELAQMTTLVKNAVGYDAGRGDSVNVVNVAFRGDRAAGPTASGTPLWDRPGVRDLLRLGIGAVLLLTLILAVLRPLLRSLVAPAPGRGHASAPMLPGAGEPAPDRVTLGANAALPPAGATQMDYDQKVALAKRVASQDPRQLAQVVQEWVSADGK